MKKRLIALLLVCVMALGMIPFVPVASAAATEREALGEINIFNGGVTLNYLTVNGRVKNQDYTYYLYESPVDGTQKEIPAYCVNPYLYGVSETVGPGESIKYNANEKAKDPKITGIVANGYPTRGLEELKVNDKYEAYYATKTALWCHLLSTWNIGSLAVNPKCSDQAAAKRVLAAAKDIYSRGMAWTTNLETNFSCSPDKSVAYPVTIDGEEYYQQIFSINSATWICDYIVDVSFAKPDEVPQGAKIVDMDDQEITSVTTSKDAPYSGVFKVIYPASSIQGESGTVQIALSGRVYQYAIFYSVCAEKSKYGDLQNYMATTDPIIPARISVMSTYGDETPPPPPDEDDEPEPETGTLRVVKLETGTETPLAGAVFEVIGPDGDTIGSFASDANGEITLPDVETGNYTVTELSPPADHLLCDKPTQNVTVPAGGTGTLTYYNDPYGGLRVEKYSNTGEGLEGVTVQIKHIVTGETQSAKTGPGGAATFDRLKPGAYEVQETAGIKGWQADTETIKTVSVVAGETSTVTLTNKELPGLRVLKYDRKSGEVLPNVTFQVWRDGELLGEYKTDALGEILITDAHPGTYLVQEVQSDDAHITETTPQQVELHAGDGIKQLVFFNDLKPGLHLTKVDSADPSKVIPNAVFEIKSVDGTFGPKEYTTGQDGSIDLSQLTPGAYVVTEKSCPGYVIDDAQRVIQLDGNENAEFVFTNSRLPSLRLIKISADGTPLSGVSFRLAKIEDGTHYLDRKTSATGEILWEGLEPGVYSLVETATLSDHILSTKEHHIELFPGKESTIVLENNKRPNLILHKRDADTGAPIADTVFLVESADGHSIQEVKTGPDGTATVENLLPGVYQITEKSVPSPYLLDAPSQLVTLFANRDRHAYFENHQAPKIEIIKENSITHDRLSNVRFQVWYASNRTSSGEYNDLGVFTTDANGRIELDGPTNGLRDGWFRVKELEPPKGYSVKDSDTQEAFIQAGKGHTFRFENTPLSAIIAWKYDSVSGLPVEGCTFRVSYLGGNTSGTGGTVIGTYRTSNNGSFTVTGLQAGTYIVEEVASDAHHVIDTAPQTVYISGEDQDVVQLFFGNSPKGNVLVKKVSAKDNTPLSDVEFLVTTSDGTVVGSANGKYVTDSAGTFLVEGIDPGTTLIIKEVRAKDGYLLDDTPQVVKVKAGETIPVEVRNRPKGGLVLQKRDSVTGAPLEGVEFELRYGDGSYVDAEGGALSSKGRYWTDSKGQIVLDGITGTVVATEVKTLSGYTIHEETRSQTVVINPGDTQTLYFENDPVGGVEIVKVSAADKTERIPDVTFEVRRMDGGLVDTVTTDEHGRVFLALEDGSYYCVEIECPKEYKIDDTPHYFEVKNGETVTVPVTNEPFSGILLHKTDSVTGKGIYGVTFLLYNSTMTPIGQYTSDNNGYVYIEGLTKSGRYYLRELENEGYIVDTQMKTVYVTAGETTLVEWANTPVTAQIQIWKKSADDNPINGLPAGTYLEGAVFEVYDKANNLVDTIRSNGRGLAVSKQLPLGRYTIREVTAPDFYSVNPTVMTAYLEYAGQIVTFEVEDDSVATGVAIQKTGYVEVMPGQEIRYTVTGVSNTSTVALQSFYWRDTLPAQVTLTRIATGTYNQKLSYKIVYRTNLSGSEYRTLADNLSTSKSYVLDASPVALGLAANERVTEFMYVFGTVKADFAQVETAYIYGTVAKGLSNGSSFVNVADVGGLYNGQWIMAVSRWVTRVYARTTTTLPRTGY